MNIYYQNELVTIYHGDCRELLDTNAAPQKAGLVLTDPPYSAHVHKNAKTNRSNKGQATKAIKFSPLTEDDLTEVFAKLGNITERWVVSTVDYLHAVALENNPPEGLRYIRTGVWVKTNPMPSLNADRPAHGWEAIAYMHRADKKPSWNGGGTHGNYVLPTVQGMGHPTVKPQPMLEDIIRKFSDPGEVVFDPFIGSGSTLLAAQNLGRKAVGVELEEEFCELAAKRLDQTTLFAL